MAIIGELIAKIHADTTTFDKNIDKSGNTLKEFNKKISETGMKMRETGGKIAMLASAPFLGVLITSLNKLKQSNDPANKSLKDLDETIGGFQMQIAKAFIPIIDEASKWIKGFADWFGSLDEGTKKTIVTVGLLVAAIGPLVAILGTFMSLGIVGVITGIAVALGGLVIATTAATNESAKYAEANKTVSETLTGEIKKTRDLISARKALKGEATEAIDAYRNGLLNSAEAIKMVDDQIYVAKNKKIQDVQKKIDELYAKARTIDRDKDPYNQELGKLQNQAQILMELRTKLLAEPLDTTTVEEIKALEKEKQEIYGLMSQNKKNQEAKRKEQLQKEKDDYIAIMKIQQQRYDKEVADQNALAELDAQITQQKIDDAMQWMNILAQSAMPVFESLGAAIIQGGDAWEAFKKAGLNAIAQVIEAFAAMWIAQGVAKIAESIYPPNAIGIASGAGLLAAGAAAYVVAGVVKNMKDGGLVMPQPGGTIVRIAEAGVPEYAVPERKDYLTRLADRITDNMSRMNIQNSFNPSFEPNFTIKLNEKELYSAITNASRDGRVVIDKRRGISKR